MSGYTQVPQGDVYGQPAYGQPAPYGQQQQPYAPPNYGQQPAYGQQPYDVKSPASSLVHHSKEERFPEQPQYRYF